MHTCATATHTISLKELSFPRVHTHCKQRVEPRDAAHLRYAFLRKADSCLFTSFANISEASADGIFCKKTAVNSLH